MLLARTVALPLILLMAGLLCAEPPARHPIPVGTQGFAAGQLLQKAYARSLEEAARPKKARTAPVAERRKTTPSVEAAPKKSATAVVVASSPPGGTPPGLLTSRASSGSSTATTVVATPAGSGDTNQAQPAAPTNTGLATRLRALFK